MPLIAGAQMTVQESQVQAVRKYPELGNKDSAFNKRFLEAYNERRKSDPSFFADPQWPLKLADELAAPHPSPDSLPSEAAPASNVEVPLPTTAPATVAKPPGEGITSEWDAGTLPKSVGLELAKFVWWAPSEVKVRGVLVLVPGRGGDGRGMARNREWQAWATANKFGLLGCFLKNPADEPYTYQHDPDGAISNLINKAVNAVLEDNKVDLKNPPLCFWGHSAGGNVSHNYSANHPERVVGAVLTRSPGGPGRMAPGKEAVPLLVLVGGQDKPDWVKGATENYEKGLAQNALWTMALHPKEGHGVGKTQELSAAFLSAAVRLRLPESGPFDKEKGKPKKLSRQAGWLGDTESLEVAAATQFKGKKRFATWLPDETVAKIWQSYLRGE